jgi:hypothetical protein
MAVGPRPLLRLSRGEYLLTVGREDQITIESWLASLGELERELMSPPPILAARCERPSLGDPFDVKATETHARTLKAQMDVAVAALAADVTRLAMIEVDNSWGDATFFTWLGADFPKDKTGTAGGNNHHHLAHANGEKKQRIDGWYHSQWAYLVDRLGRVKEGNGTLLDNTIVVIANDARNGGSHSIRNVPWILAGGKNLGFRRGRYLKADNVAKQKVLMAVADGLGAELPDFGGHTALGGLRG